MSEVKYNINIILTEIENIHANFVDLSNVCKIAQLQSITEIFSSLSIIKLSCFRLLDINDFNTQVLEKIINKIESISLYSLVNIEDKCTQLDSIINLTYNLGIIVTLFDTYL
jgi:hypothetical protein